MKKTAVNFGIFKLVLALVLCAILLLTIVACNGNLGIKQVPVYKGMVISKNLSASAMAAGEYSHGNDKDDHKHGPGCTHGDHGGRDEDLDDNHPFGDKDCPSIEDVVDSTLDVIGADKEVYYADRNEDIYITIKLSNPDSFEILSFTLNGKKYSNYMFEDGSDMENLVLKVNVGEAEGFVDYTIDAIKYVDGTDIKDVRMDGDRTVRAGVRSSKTVEASVSNEVIDLDSISFDVTVIDQLNIIEQSGGNALALLYDGDTLDAEKLTPGEEHSLKFENLNPNTVYQYAVIAYFDDLSGAEPYYHTLFLQSFYTDAIVLFDNLVVEQEAFSWDYLWHDTIANKEIIALELQQDGKKVKDLDVNSRQVTELNTNNAYTLVATYKNLEGKDETIAVDFITLAKAVPVVEIQNLASTQTGVSFGIDVEDVDGVGAVSKIELLHGNDAPVVASDNTVRAFEDLLSNNEYKVRVTYTYDLNDGNGKQNVVAEKSVKTLAKAKPTVSVENAVATQTSVAFDVAVTDTDSVGAISKIELVHDGGVVVATSGDVRTFENLLSDNEYKIVVTYTYDLNDGVGEQTIKAEKTITTLAKAKPTVSIENLTSEQDYIEFDVNYVDVDEIGGITDISLFSDNAKVATTAVTDHIKFEGLESGKKYTIAIEYAYDRNDGKGEQKETYTMSYSTLIDSIAVEDMVLLNNGIVREGEEINLRVYFVNSSEIEMTAIYVNGQRATVVGGDRIESAIIKFIPDETGLCKFYVDRVDYVINGFEVNQAIDTDVMVQYPVYKDLDIKYTAVTASPYENTGEGVYFTFDNSDGYTVYSINNGTSFVKLSDDEYFTYGTSISSIEYGYDNYGKTTQKCSFSSSTRSVGSVVLVYDAEDFFAMTSGYYVLMNDLDLRDVQITAPIALTGILDGNGHTIRGLSNVIDTSKASYFNLFSYCSIYDVTFKELYVSVNSTSSITVNPLGDATLYNCTVKGDIVCSGSAQMGQFYAVQDSLDCDVNVINGSQSYKMTKTNSGTLRKDPHITDDGFGRYFTIADGKRYLLNIWPSDINEYNSEIDGVFAVKSGALNYVSVQYLTVPGKYLNSLSTEDRQNFVELVLLNDGYLTSIGNYAFKDCTNLTSVTIGDSVTTIGSQAFYACRNLTSVTIGNSVTTIDRHAFMYCTNLTSVTIPDSVTYIGYEAFYGCSNLTSVTLGNSVTTIDKYAFMNCYVLAEVYNYSSLNITKGSGEHGEVASFALDVYTTNEPSKLTTDENGFVIHTNGDVKTLVNHIGTAREITIPDSVTTIGEWIFYYIGLKSITIPDSVTSIGSYAFHCDHCDGLTDVYYTGTEEQWNAISIGYSNEHITHATKYYYSEDEPTTSGNYWHYVDGVPTKW